MTTKHRRAPRPLSIILTLAFLASGPLALADDLTIQGNLNVQGTIDADGNKVKSVADPTDDDDAATKGYVDDQAAGDLKADGSVPLTGDLDAAGHKIKGVAAPTDPADAATKGHVDANFVNQNHSGPVKLTDNIEPADTFGMGLHNPAPDSVLTVKQLDERYNQVWSPNVLTYGVQFVHPDKVVDAVPYYTIKPRTERESLIRIPDSATPGLTPKDLFGMGADCQLTVGYSPATADTMLKWIPPGSDFSPNLYFHDDGGFPVDHRNHWICDGVVADDTPMFYPGDIWCIKNNQTTDLVIHLDNLSRFRADADLDAGGRRVTDVAEPTADSDAATKGYVDAADAGGLKADGSVSMTAPLNFGGMRAANLHEPILTSDAATRGYVDTAMAKTLKHDGSMPLTGNMNAAGHKIAGLGMPTAAADAATKEYVDAADTALQSSMDADFVKKMHSGQVTITDNIVPADTAGWGLQNPAPDSVLSVRQLDARYGQVWLDDDWPFGVQLKHPDRVVDGVPYYTIKPDTEEYSLIRIPEYATPGISIGEMLGKGEACQLTKGSGASLADCLTRFDSATSNWTASVFYRNDAGFPSSTRNHWTTGGAIVDDTPMFYPGDIFYVKNIDATDLLIHLDNLSRFRADTNLDAGGMTIASVATPVADTDAATKGYVDTATADLIKADGSVAMTDDLNLGDNDLNGVQRIAFEAGGVIRVTDGANASHLSLCGGGTILSGAGAKIRLHGANYGGNAGGLEIKTGMNAGDITFWTGSGTDYGFGDRMTIRHDGIVDVHGNSIVNLAEPQADSEAATKSYVDSKTANLYWNGYELLEPQYVNGEPQYTVLAGETHVMQIPGHFRGPLTVSDMLGAPGEQQWVGGVNSTDSDYLRRWDGISWGAAVFYKVDGPPPDHQNHWVSDAAIVDDVPMFYPGDIVSVKAAGADLTFILRQSNTIDMTGKRVLVSPGGDIAMWQE